MSMLLMLNRAASAEPSWMEISSGIDEEEFGAVSVCGSNPDVAYAAVSGGVYKTKNGGASWERSLYLGRENARFIAVEAGNAEIVYAATDKGLYRTKNGGLDWGRIFSGRDRENIIMCIALGPQDPPEIYIGTERGLFKSENSGGDWGRAEGLAGKRAVYQITVHPIRPGLVYAVSDKGLFKSNDGGASWQEVFKYVARQEEEAEPESETIEEAESGSPKARSVALDPRDTAKVYLGTLQGIFESSDAGASWHWFSDEGLVSNKINFLWISPLEPVRLYAATEEGVFRFSEDEERWLELYPDAGVKKARFITCGLEKEDPLWVATERSLYKTSEKTGPGASVGPETHDILACFENEPSVREIQEAAIMYAEVHPEKIARWRKGAKARALLPKLSFGIDRDSSKGLHWDAGSNPDTWVIGPEDEDTGWDITCTWDLGDLIWSDDQTQIDIRSKLMAQLRDDVLDETTRYYFERRRLQVEMLDSPPQDVPSQIRNELRLQELTANIDALTGGHLSDHLDK